MQKRNVFMAIMLQRFVRANRIPAVHSPLILPFSKLGQRGSGEALNAFDGSEGRARHSVRAVSLLQVRDGQATAHPTTPRVWKLAAKASLLLLLVALALSAQAGVREVGPIGLTVGDLDRELTFYTNTLPFQLVSISEVSGQDRDALLGLHGVHLRVATLKLGDEHITLTAHIGNRGRPIPADSQSYDHWFQHIAIVVHDMDKAYEQLRLHKVKHVSTAPQTLPAWNKGAAGIKAFYFRDPEDHVLEIIWFPPGKGDPKWQRSRRREEADTLSRGESSPDGYCTTQHPSEL